MNIGQVIADNVKFIRQKRHLSRETLATKAGLSDTYIWYIEQAKKNVTVFNLQKIAKVLKVPLATLIEPEAHLKIEEIATDGKKKPKE